MTSALTDSGMQTQQSTLRDYGITPISIYHSTAALLFLPVTGILAFSTMIRAIVTVTEAPPAAIDMSAVGLMPPSLCSSVC